MAEGPDVDNTMPQEPDPGTGTTDPTTVSYTHLRAHETRSNLVCRLLLEKNFF